MAYRTFETDTAIYSLVYAKHVLGATSEDILQLDRIGNLDGIVLEAANEPTAKMFVGGGQGLRGKRRMVLEGKNMYKNDQYGLILENVKELAKGGQTLPIYIGDCSINAKFMTGKPAMIPSLAVQMGSTIPRQIAGRKLGDYLSRLVGKKFAPAVNLLTQAAVMSPEILAGLMAFFKGEKDSNLDDIIAAAGMFPPTPVLEFRNALIAAKLEDYLAPQLKDKLGRKPHLAIIYGAAHAGIKHDLLDKNRRDKVLRLYRKMNYLWFNRPTIDNLLELTVDDRGSWAAREYTTGVK